MAKVKQSYVGTLNGGTTIGIQLPILVNSGADGSYVIAANQIAWGESHFDDKTFGGTTEGLLTAIESAIDNKTVDLSEYVTYSYVTTYVTNTVTTHANDTTIHITSTDRSRLNQAYNAAFNAKERIDTFLDGENVTEAVDTLKDIQNYITTHGEEAATMVTNITKAQNRADAAYTYASNVGAVADNAQNRADAAYAYASNVGAVADNAQNRADAAYAYASNVGAVADNAQNRADAAYEYAGSAWTYAGDANEHAGRAYTYASNVGSVADEALAAAYNAQGTIDAFLNGENVTEAVDTLKDIQNYITTHGTEATNMVTNITAAQNRANEAYTHADDVLNKAYEAITSSATEITYTFVSATSSQGKFISSVDILPKPDKPHDFEFRFTYYTLKAEDYWEEYVPANE